MSCEKELNSRNPDDWKKCFPYPEPRSDQPRIIEKVIDAYINGGKKFAIIEAPTGTGKSAIGYTLGRFFNDYYYITAQKILQSQLNVDFGENGKWSGNHPMIELKGRNAYKCDYYAVALSDSEHPPLTDSQIKRFRKLDDTNTDCAKGECKRKGKSSLKYCRNKKICQYFNQVGKAVYSDAVLMNFHSFIFQTEFVKDRWPNKTLLIIDECFHPHTYIQTDIGRLAIGTIVNKKIKCNVLSYNLKNNSFEFKPITRWLKREKQLTYKVLAGNRILYPTINHKIYTPDGKKKLSELKVGDNVLINEPSITKIQQQLLLGSLLGDASVQLVPSKRISNKYINKGIRSRVKFQHGPKQVDYLNWKYTIIQDHVKTIPKSRNNAGFTSVIWSFNTKCTIHNAIKSIFVNNKKSPNREWLDQINDLGLAIWYMDDGSISSDVMHFNTEGFTKSENDIICQWLIDTYNVPARVLFYKKRNKILYYISVGRDGGRIISGRIAKFIPPCMRYKLPSGEWDDYDDTIESIRSSPISIDQIKLIEPYKISSTYDLEVADNHNYFAGSTLVSNCHNAEQVLMDYVSFRINDLSYDFDLPKFDTAEEYLMFFEEIKLLDMLKSSLEEAMASGNSDDEEHWVKQINKYEHFKSSMEHHEWISRYEQKILIKTSDSNNKKYREIELKPLFISDFAHDLLFNKADLVLMMSATILDVNIICESLGIDRNEVYATRINSDFPVKNRPIYYRPSGNMSFKEKESTLPKMIKDINKICDEYQDHKGIIHTHNFEIAEYIKENISNKHLERLFYQHAFDNKDIMLSIHSKSQNGIIVAPAMHEGLDLKDDLSRFQIICKIPYPGLGNNPQLKRRMELSDDYYSYLTALKLIQQYGRSVRSKDDYADTYILDSGFKGFFERSKKMFPSWFIEAIIWK